MPALNDGWTAYPAGALDALFAKALEQFGHALDAVVGLHPEGGNQEASGRDVGHDVFVAEGAAEAAAEQARQLFGDVVAVLRGDGQQRVHLDDHDAQRVAVAPRDADHAVDDRHDRLHLGQPGGRIQVAGEPLRAAALDAVAGDARPAPARSPLPGRSRPRRPRRRAPRPRRRWRRRRGSPRDARRPIRGGWPARCGTPARRPRADRGRTAPAAPGRWPSTKHR